MRDAEIIEKKGIEEVTGGLADTRTGHFYSCILNAYFNLQFAF